MNNYPRNSKQPIIRRQQQYCERKKCLTEDEMQKALNSPLEPCQSIIKLLSKWEVKTFELQEAIGEIQQFSSTTLQIFLKALIILAQSKKEQYFPYIFQVIFCEKIQNQIAKDINSVVSDISRLGSGRGLQCGFRQFEIFDQLLMIFEHTIQFIFPYEEAEKLIQQLSIALKQINKFNEGKQDSWEILITRLTTLINSQDLFQQAFIKKNNFSKQIIQYYGIINFCFENYYTYRQCPIEPCHLDYQYFFEDKGTLCGPIDNQDMKSPKDFFKFHFLLLREDQLQSLKQFIARLRKVQFERIAEILEQYQIYLYYNICFESIFAGQSSFKILLTATAFNPLQEIIDWSKTKRLLSGSFLALTSTKLQDFIYAQVVDRPRQNLKENRFFLTIKLINISSDQYLSLINKYIAVKEQLIILESPMFYDVYKSFLKCLQEKKSDDYPFKDQIMQSSKETPKQPLEVNPSQLAFQINQLFSQQQQNAMHLDPSQQKAILAILNNKIALIQGPPGTGKTFCGALAVNLLLQKINCSPILIVCQTNHALDQFLNHIIKFCGKESIVRIGGRCKVEDFQSILLSTLREERFKQIRNIDEYRQTQSYILSVQLYYIREKLNKRLKYALNLIDNIHYKDVVKYCEILEQQIVKQYLQIEELYFQTPISEQSKKIIVHMWLDGFNPRKEQLDKIIVYEKSQGNQLLTESTSDTKFHKQGKQAYGSTYNENSIFSIQNEDKIKDVPVNNTIDSDEEENRKIFYQLEDDYSALFTTINEELSLKRFHNRLKYDNAEQLAGLQSINEAGYNIWMMSQNQRNAIQQYIMEKKMEKIYLNNSKLLEQYDSLILKLQELNIQMDLEIMQSKKIIGLTFSGCAKYAETINQLNYEVMVVEEAGEVLESHLVAVLSEKVKHLIMIGDHQQLRPNLNCYQLQVKFNANISLFEKLINNGMEYVSLEYQRRMKTKFADFIRLIYPNYKDHFYISDINDKQIPGMHLDLIYFNHHWNDNQDSYSYSKFNKQEARMIVLFAEYLIKNGISPEKITILSLYSKQALLIQHQLFSEIKVQTVDNFQGEENDIIIISLVRSNKVQKLGFVAIDNRVCVALSRARLCLYVFGNFDFIEDAIKTQDKTQNQKSSLWLKLISLAKQKNVLLDFIPLQCDSHNEITYIKTIQDWSQVKNGGCTKICGKQFSCGHICKELCHKLNHTQDNCQHKCGQQLLCGHYCEGLCKETPCPPCKKIVEKLLPNCLHIINLECGQQLIEAKCSSTCNKLLLCGHQCKLQCWEDCKNNRCMEVFTYAFQFCGHKSEIICDDYKYITSIKCKVKCDKLLQCGHMCLGICGLCFSKFHQPCKSKCNKLLNCGHLCDERCGQFCYCKSQCDFECNCNIKCKKICHQYCDLCQNQCTLKCSHSQCSKQCWEYCDREPCNQQCNKKLRCGCQCLGLCGEVCPSICQIISHNNKVCIETKNFKFYQLECQNYHIFQVDELDKYFSSQSLQNFIRCPKCQQIIWKSRRYQKYIKKTLISYNSKKQESNVSLNASESELNKILKQTTDLIIFIKEKGITDTQGYLLNLIQYLKQNLQQIALTNSYTITIEELRCLQFQVRFYPMWIELMNCGIQQQSFMYHLVILTDQYLLNEDFRKFSQQVTLYNVEQKIQTLYLYSQIFKALGSGAKDSNEVLSIIEKDEFFLTEKSRQELLVKYADIKLQLQ